MLFRAYFVAAKIACLSFVVFIVGSVTDALSGFLPQWFGSLVLFPYFVIIIATGLAALHFRFRSACPRCGEKGAWTRFGNDLAINCPRCGLVYGNPWYSFRFEVLPHDASEEEPGPVASSSENDDSAGEVFFECSRNGRQWPHLIFGLIFGAVGAGIVVPGTILALIDHQAQLASVTAWLVFLVVAPAFWIVFVFVPAYLLWNFVRNPVYEFCIDRSGIRSGSSQYAWKSIRWVGTRGAGSGDNVYFAFGSWWRPDAMFPTYPPLPHDEACDVLDKLEPFLRRHFPDVEICD